MESEEGGGGIVPGGRNAKRGEGKGGGSVRMKRERRR